MNKLKFKGTYNMNGEICDEEITPDNFSFDKFQESFNKRFELIKHALECYNSNIGIEIAKAIEEAK